MAARSLKVAADKIHLLKTALKGAGCPSMQAFVTQHGNEPGYSTVKNFFGGKPIDRLNFIELSERLGLNPEGIAAVEADGDAGTGLEESLFVVGPPITKPCQFFGRERELRRLFGLIKRLPLQNAAIIGARRSGKTSLLLYLKSICTTPEAELRPGQRNDWLPQAERYCWVYVDFQDAKVQGRVGLMTHLLEGMGLAWREGAKPSLEQFMDVVSEGLKRPTVVLMDEVGVAMSRCEELDDSFWESLRSLATTQTNGLLGFVLATARNPMDLAKATGHSSPFFNIFGYSAQLGPLKEDEAEDLMGAVELGIPAEEMAWMYEKSLGWPVVLQTLLREYLLAEEESGIDWKQEAEAQIQGYAHLLEQKE